MPLTLVLISIYNVRNTSKMIVSSFNIGLQGLGSLNNSKNSELTWKSKVSSQLKTRTNLPSWFPRAFTDSVLPVPAGPRQERKSGNQSKTISPQNIKTIFSRSKYISERKHILKVIYSALKWKYLSLCYACK